MFFNSILAQSGVKRMKASRLRKLIEDSEYVKKIKFNISAPSISKHIH